MSLTKAQIAVGNPNEATPIDVCFNPASLRITTTNQLKDDNPNEASKPTAYKLDVELLFDTTETGQDIYEVTRPLRWAAIATAQGAAAPSNGGSTDEPPRDLSLVAFIWGSARYYGYIESLNETIDYFSSDGTPLRSTIQVGLKGFTRTFVHGELSNVANYTQSNDLPAALDLVMMPQALDSDRVFTAASQSGGDRSTGRGLAALNGVENMRTGAGAFAGASAFAGAGAGANAGAVGGAVAGAGVAAGAGVSLRAAAGFTLAGGVSAGASAGFGIGASAGLSASAGVGASVGVGMTAGAGVGMGAGAGIGLGAGTGLSMGASAGFSASGSVSASTGAGMGRGSAAASLAAFSGASSFVTTGSASAGVSAGAGAFSGLGTASGTRLPSADFNVNRLLPPPSVTTANVGFDLSGRAIAGGTAAKAWSTTSTANW